MGVVIVIWAPVPGLTYVTPCPVSAVSGEVIALNSSDSVSLTCDAFCGPASNPFA